MKRLLILTSLLAMSLQTAWAIDYTSAATGNWNVATNWSPNGIPGTGDNVTITTHTMTLTGAETCNNITVQGTSGTRLALGTFTLTVEGTLTGPRSSSSISATLISGTGTIKFTGGSRSIFEYAGSSGTNYYLTSINGFNMDVSLTSGATATMSSVGTGLRVTTLAVNTGNFDMGIAEELRVGGSTDGTGSLTIASGSELITQSVRRISSGITYPGTVTVNGTLTIYGTVLNGTTVTINGRLKLKSNSGLGSTPASIADSEFAYGPNAIVEISPVTGNASFGAESDRFASNLLTTTIPNLEINLATNTNTVSMNLKDPIVNNLNLMNGRINANSSYVLTVNTTITTGSGSYINVENATANGGLKRVGGGLFPVGLSTGEYMPLTITSTGAAENYTVQLAALTAGLSDPTKAVQRQWEVKEQTAGGNTVDLAFEYPASIVGMGYDLTAATGQGLHYIGGTWKTENNAMPITGGPTGPFAATLSGISTFSPFTVGTAGALPIQLLTFTGKAVGKSNILNWQTGIELNVAKMMIERSSDQQNWKVIGTVAPQGSHSTYQWEDAAPLPVAYYRLKTQDLDGTVRYSYSVAISRKGAGVVVASTYPNPVQDILLVNVEAGEEAEILFQIFDLQGRIVAQQNALVTDGSNQVQMDMGRLASGVYLLKMAGESEAIRLVKE
jgi:Secretion system C-terminal sorting domain